MTSSNGTLSLLALSAMKTLTGNFSIGPLEHCAFPEREEERIEQLAVPQLIKAGDVVAFSSTLWHRSDPNLSGSNRRAYYCQYSQTPIVPSKTNLELAASPLQFAIRLTKVDKKAKAAGPAQDQPDQTDTAGGGSGSELLESAAGLESSGLSPVVRNHSDAGRRG
jgi:ectoine hydroxylase-related dioxygenase (phytanoyl-CoA dioxygenase family)